MFFVVYLISVIIFYYLDFFKIKDCRGNELEPDWGKILGYALLPSFILSLISYIICVNVKSNKRRSRSRFGFDDDYEHDYEHESRFRFNNPETEFEANHSNYSCGMW